MIGMTTETAKTEQIYPDVVPGAKVKVSVRIKDVNKKGEEKERIQNFEGMVLGRKHGSEPGATITVRKVSGGIGVEKIFPLHSPVIAGIEVLAKYKVRRAKLNFLRKPEFRKKLREIKDEQPKKPKAKKAAKPAKAEAPKAEAPATEKTEEAAK